MTKDEALTLALETLKSGVKTQANRIAWIEYDSCLIKEAITAIKEALSQPEYQSTADKSKLEKVPAKGTLLAQPERDPWREAVVQPERDPWREAAAQPEERNFCPRCGKRLASGFVEISIHTCTPPKPEQEPECSECKAKLLYECVACSNNNYPPQLTWVGLTLDERLDLAQDVDWAAGAYCEYAEKVEAKLKEKNK